MRLVIETTDEERGTLGKFLRTFDGPPTYSALFRVLLRLAVEGKVPRKLLASALASPRPVLSVKLNEAAKEPKTKETKPSIPHGWDIK